MQWWARKIKPKHEALPVLPIGLRQTIYLRFERPMVFRNDGNSADAKFMSIYRQNERARISDQEPYPAPPLQFFRHVLVLFLATLQTSDEKQMLSARR